MTLNSKQNLALRWLLCGLVLVLTTLSVSPLHAKPGGRPGTAGVYRIQVRGTWSGELKVRLSATDLQIPTSKLVNEAGAEIKLKLKSVPVENGRFSGTDTIEGRAVEIFGRVDAAEGGVVESARLTMHIRFADDGSCVRLYGARTEN